MAGLIASWRTGPPILAALLLLSCDEREAKISVDHGWTRETAPGQVAAVYATIRNAGDGTDRLVEAKSATAAAATLHSSSSSGGVARMRVMTEGVEIPAHSQVEFKPGAMHVMLTGMKTRLSPGETIGLDLVFARSGTRPVAVRVVPVTEGEDHSRHGMNM